MLKSQIKGLRYFKQVRLPAWHWVYIADDNNIYNEIGGLYFKWISLDEFYRLHYDNI
jgi:hypothetical protein